MPKSTPALHTAAFLGRVDEIERLLDEGSDVNVRDYANWTPLHVAVDQGHVDAVKLLLKKDADKEARNHSRQTPLHWAATAKIKSFSTLAGCVEKEKERILPAREEILKLLVAEGANVNVVDEWGATPLHDAVSGLRARVVEFLLAQGAIATTVTRGEDTVLDALAHAVACFYSDDHDRLHDVLAIRKMLTHAGCGFGTRGEHRLVGEMLMLCTA